MNASSQEKPNWLPLIASKKAQATAPMPPSTISTVGTCAIGQIQRRAVVAELVCELIAAISSTCERICSGTSSTVPNWLSCNARK